MIDLDVLAQLAPPSGEGSVTLRTSVFVELVSELREFYRLFSDYEEPCESFAHAQALWHMMKDREGKLHQTITALRAQIELLEGGSTRC